ncbi:MAG: leucine-rich repeat protein, partial [Bacillota bacterium]
AGDLQSFAKLYIIDDDEYTGDLPSYYTDYKSINFIVDNSVYCSPMQVQKGTIPAQPDSYTPPGYTLDGWYIDRDYSQKFDFNEPLNENITLFGNLTLNEPKFIYDTENNLIEELMHPDLPYKQITFPQKDIYNQPLKGIKADALKDNTTIESITIPDNYQEIGNQAFNGCTALEEVIIGEGSQLQDIGIAAFDNCKELHTFDLPNNITEIGGFAFRNCKNLDITNIPSGIDTLNQYVFSNTKTVSVDLENITTILEGAFDGVSALETVTNAHNVERCYKYAFRNTKIYTDSVASEERAAYIDTMLVGARDHTSHLTLRENITLIADEALKASSLSNMILQIPYDMPLRIGENVFEETIAILIDQDFFPIISGDILFQYRSQVCIQQEENDFQLLKFRLSSENYTYDIKQYNGDKVYLDITEEFPDYTFRNVREGAFQNSEDRTLNLKTLNLGNIERIFPFGVANIDSLMAIFFTKETPAALPNNMAIARSSLAGGTVKIYVPDELVSVYKGRTQWAYLQNHIYSMDIIENNMALRTFQSGNGYIIQYFGDDESVSMPQDQDINFISENAFMHNTSVKHITISENIEEILYRAFAYTKIETITFLSEEPPLMNSLILHGNTNLQTIYVPEGKRSEYIDALPASVKNIAGLEVVEL